MCSPPANELFQLSLDHKRGGKKKKKKKPTDYFLRLQRKEKEIQERKQQERQEAPKELLPCHYYLGGKCAKVMLETSSFQSSYFIKARLHERFLLRY